MRRIAHSSLVDPYPRQLPVQVLQPTAAVVRGAAFESLRLLALTLRRVLAEEQRRVIALMSAHPRDGRSLCAAALAQTLADLLPPVVLVDGDPVGAGLNGFGASAPTMALQSAAPSLTVDTIGRTLPPLTVFAPSRWAEQSALVEQVEAALEAATLEGATVIIDTPPCTVSSLAFQLAGLATGVLYIARKRVQDSVIHREVRGQLDLLGVPVIGVVFNEG